MSSPDEREARDLYKGALKWWKRGYNVVPQALDGSKHPCIKWKEYQDRHITRGEVAQHSPLYTRGVGFITGAISGAIVVESDGPEGEAVLQKFEELHGPLPGTLTIRSGGPRPTSSLQASRVSREDEGQSDDQARREG